MLITDEFVFTHMPKAGGTFVTSSLKEFYRQTGGALYDTNKDDYATKHAMLGGIPEEHQHKPILLNVRNPFSHLVSMYNFKWWHENPDEIFDVAQVAQRFPSFPDFEFGEFLVALNQWDIVKTPGWMTPLVPHLQHHGIGSLSMWYLPGMLSDSMKAVENFDDFMRNPDIYRHPNLHIIRTENLGEDLYQFLLKMGHAPDDIAFIRDREDEQPALKERKNSQEVYNQGKHKKPFRDYYTPALVQYVLHKERAIFELLPEYSSTFDDSWMEGSPVEKEVA